MISTDTLPQLLTQLGFSKHGASYSKTIGSATLKVDTKEQRITYPDGLTVNGEFTCNFSSSENFVVLECVNRLLEKGYKAEHIELEPKWKLGHGASGGRADILLTDNQKKPLLIIECKTAGREFDKAWRNTLQDGDQLFSYAQQISETQFLCLYASDFDNGVVSYQSHIIAHRDNEKYLADNPNFKSFKEVSDVKNRYAVWRDTYKLDYTSKGIFESNIQPYHIGKDKYALADLQAISESDQQKKYHEFATILRQHNVSGRENAFDKLVNLFLCKLVDETENPNELKFYWKGVAYDTHFELLDRLQQLYQAGMGKFLGEQITYINQTQVFNAMRFIRTEPDVTQRAVWELFVKQKFFTNNDFSLIDVHNEKLFYQNAEVLLKILQMWQDIRLTNNSGNNQFLGDMFEGFLDQGVKQSEGQYFTPMPICRFILMSLPLQSLIQNSSTPPKAIDYACGAGHFLNELASQLKPLVAQHKQTDIADYHKAIYGIEKEYRLSKVAKVSAFMYGQADINICYGDALVNQHAAFPEIQNGSFDVLVANPPYSVRGFLETLSEEERAVYSFHNEYLVTGPAIIVGRKGSAGEVIWESENCFPIDTTFYVKPKRSDIDLFYLFQALKTLNLEKMRGGSGVPGLNRNEAYQVKFPLPPLDIQQKIVAECEAVDAESTAAQASISNAYSSIEQTVSHVFSGRYSMQKLGHASVALLNPSKAEIKNVDDDTLVTFVEMAAVSEAGLITAPVNKPLKELRKGSYTYFAENDIILAKITPCMENGKCALAKGLENGLGLGSSEFHVVRANPKAVLPEYLFALLNRQSLRETAETVMTGSSGHRRVPATFYANLDVPVPPLADQQKLVAEVEALERDIASAQAVIAAAPAKKQAIMQRYL